MVDPLKIHAGKVIQVFPAIVECAVGAIGFVTEHTRALFFLNIFFWT